LEIKSHFSTLSLNEFLGFHLANKVDLRELGLLYYVLTSLESLSEALRRTQRYRAIQNEGVLIKYNDNGPVFVRHLSACHQIEFFVTMVVRVCRHLTARRLNPSRIKFAQRFDSEIDEDEHAPVDCG